MKNDVIINKYLSDNERFADLYNHQVFRGIMRISPEELSDINPLSGMALHGEEGDIGAIKRNRDIVKKVSGKTGIRFMILGMENQMKIHYAMPLRCMLYDALTYNDQVSALKKQHKKNKDKMDGTEYLSGMRKTDTISPVMTQVVYYGEEEWDGPMSVFDMFGDEVDKEFLRQYIPDYSIRVINICKIKDYEKFETDLKAVFGLIKNKDSKQGFKEFIEKNKEHYKNMASDAYEVAAVFMHKKQLLEFERLVKTDEGGIDMCKAIDEMILEGEQRGEQRGEKRGEQKGKLKGELIGLELMGRLAKKMFEDGKTKEFFEFACEQDKRQDLLEKYQII